MTRLATLRRRLARAIDPGRPADAPSASGVGDPAGEGGWWDLLPFTTHRIRFAEGIESMHGGVDTSADVRVEIVDEALTDGVAGRSVVDLGCAEGGFALAFAAAGASSVLGIEARDLSVRRARLARDLLGLDNAEFVVADIKEELERRGRFDVVFATGILYHVSDPAGMLGVMREACGEVALIDTHVAHPDVASHGCSDVVERTFGGSTYRGRLYTEYDPATSDADKEDMLWAAWSDPEVFWPFEDDLVEMIRDAGFVNVERVDPLDGTRRTGWAVDHLNRVMYLARP